MSSDVEIKSRHQRAGHLWKLPMSKSTGERWQRRMFIAKDGFLLYYGERANSTPDGNFSHNFQAWVPLQFDDSGAMLPMTFPASFQLDLANATAVEPGAGSVAGAGPKRVDE